MISSNMGSEKLVFMLVMIDCELRCFVVGWVENAK